VKIVNRPKRPRNFLNETQNVFINGKQVKTDEKQIRDFHAFTQQQLPATHSVAIQPTCVTFARWQRLPTEVSGCGQLAGSLRSYKTLQTRSPHCHCDRHFYSCIPCEPVRNHYPSFFQ